MKTAAVLAATALLCACAASTPPQWTKAGASQRDFDMDFDACRVRAASLPEPPRPTGTPQSPRDLPGVALSGGGRPHPDFIEACLRERGWQLH